MLGVFFGPQKKGKNKISCKIVHITKSLSKLQTSKNKENEKYKIYMKLFKSEKCNLHNEHGLALDFLTFI